MKDITTQILSELRAATYSHTVDTGNIREAGMMRLTGYPSITIQTLDNRNESGIGGREMLSALTYQIEVYAKNTVEGGIAIGRDTIARELAQDIDLTLRTTLLLRRTFGSLIPYDDDTSRYVLRYECAVTEADYIYRR